MITMAALVIGAGVLAGAVAAGWHSMSPTSQLYGRTFTGVSPATRSLALTFDDGPSESTTVLLRVLAEHNVAATFFQCGANVERLP